MKKEIFKKLCMGMAGILAIGMASSTSPLMAEEIMADYEEALPEITEYFELDGADIFIEDIAVPQDGHGSMDGNIGLSPEEIMFEEIPCQDYWEETGILGKAVPMENSPEEEDTEEENLGAEYLEKGNRKEKIPEKECAEEKDMEEGISEKEYSEETDTEKEIHGTEYPEEKDSEEEKPGTECPEEGFLEKGREEGLGFTKTDVSVEEPIVLEIEPETGDGTEQGAGLTEAADTEPDTEDKWEETQPVGETLMEEPSSQHESGSPELGMDVEGNGIPAETDAMEPVYGTDGAQTAGTMDNGIVPDGDAEDPDCMEEECRIGTDESQASAIMDDGDVPEASSGEPGRMEDECETGTTACGEAGTETVPESETQDVEPETAGMGDTDGALGKETEPGTAAGEEIPDVESEPEPATESAEGLFDGSSTGREVSILADWGGGVPAYGNTVMLHAVLKGYDMSSCHVFWEVQKGETWELYADNTESCSFVLDNENVSWKWRVGISVTNTGIGR